MKYFKVTPGSNANRKVGNESYVLFKKGIKNEILLTIFNEDFPSCELKFSPLYLEEPPYTDLLEDYSMGYGLTISERAFTVIKALNLGKHKFYELANVYDGDTRIQLNFKYYRLELIKIPSHYLDTVDFGNSVWATKKFNTDIEKEVRIENYEKYKELKKEDNNLYFKKLKFIKGNKNIFSDLFKLHELSMGFTGAKDLICSENFKQVVENNQLTGFEFNEIEIEFEDEIL